MQEIIIIHEPTTEEPFVVINKPAGLPSAPLNSEDKENAYSCAEELFPELKKINGKKQIEYGLLHRLDTQTSGLLLIASSQDFYDFMQKEQINGKFEKTYTAECNLLPNNAENLMGFPTLQSFNINYIESILNNDSIKISSFFRNFGVGLKEVRPVLSTSGKAAIKKCKSTKEYSTTINLIKKTDEKLILKCKIVAGYRHQVRCHLAWLGIPVIGDSIYNYKDKNKESCSLHFRATGLSFYNQKTDKVMNFNLE